MRFSCSQNSLALFLRNNNTPMTISPTVEAEYTQIVTALYKSVWETQHTISIHNYFNTNHIK